MYSKKLIDEMLDKLIKKCGGFAELFIEDAERTEICIKNGDIKNVIKNRLVGCGIRVIKEGKEYYASTNDLSKSHILNCINELSYIANCKTEKDIIFAGVNSKIKKITKDSMVNINSFINKNKKIAGEIDNAARRYYQVKQTDISIWETRRNVLIVNSNGICAQDERNRSRLVSSIIAREGDAVEENILVKGICKKIDFLDEFNVEAIGNVCAKQAIELLKADRCPSGKMPIVISGGTGGSIFHEACGHSLEAACVARGNSEFSGKLGEKIASSLVTLVDDGTIKERWGTNVVDDEGLKCRKNILIENGVLKGYLVDYVNSVNMGLPTTGSARRESYCFPPTSRMTNTYIASGSDSEKEIISTVDYGIYVEEFKGGSVNPVTGEFNVGILRAYLIKNGKIDRPIKGGSLIGIGSDIMKKIDRVGRKLMWSEGMCGAKSGLIPVGIGQPMIRIKEGMVGGNG